MKKIMKKLTAVLLMAALVFSVIGVPDTAFAASSKITLKSGEAAPSIIYAGHSYSLKVPGANVKFYTTDKKVATIGLTTGKLKPTAPGAVTIKAKSKKTGKDVARKTFTVRQRCTSVKASDIYLNPGDSAYVKAKLTPSTSTDVIRFYSNDKEIVTIGSTSGKARAYQKGETTIKVIAKASNSTSSSNKANKATNINVYVGAYIDSAQQLETTRIKLGFKTDITGYDMKASDFSISNSKTKRNFTVKDISVSGNSVILTTNDKINDGGTYTVKYDKSSAQFTATDGRITGMEISPTVVPEKTLTEINVNLKDKNGVVVESYNTANKPKYVDFSISTSSGFVNYNGKLYLNNLQSTATARAVYHTYEYEKDESGKTVESGMVDTGNVTITASEIREPDPTPSYNPYSVQITTAEIYKLNLSGDEPVRTLVPDFDSPTNMVYCPNDTAEQTTVPLYFYITKYGEEVENYGDYTVSISNDNVAEIYSAKISTDAEAGTIDNSNGIAIDNDTHSIRVKGKRAGTTYLFVKNKNGTVVSTLYLLGGDKAPKYEFGYLMMRLYGNNLTSGKSTDSISVCNNTHNSFGQSSLEFIGVTIRSMLYGRPMNYVENSSVSLGLKLSSFNGDTNVKDITGPISDYDIKLKSDDDIKTIDSDIITIDAGRICSNGYVKPGRYNYLVTLYTIEYYSDNIHSYKKHITTKYFDVNVSGIDINKVELKKGTKPITADAITAAKSSGSTYDWTEFVNSAYNIYVESSQGDEIKVAVESVSIANAEGSDENSITFESITFKLLQNDAYVYYTYNFAADDALATVSATSDYSGTTITESNIPAGE